MSYLANLNNCFWMLFLFSDFSSLISRQDKIFQNYWPQPFDWSLVHNIAFIIDLRQFRDEILFSSHWIAHFFAQCSWLPIKQVIQFKKVETEKKQWELWFRTDLGDQVIDSWTVDDFFQPQIKKNPLIENWTLASQCRSPYGIQTPPFICNIFGCKLWLRSIQNHAKENFQSFCAPPWWHHLKWLCCSIGI